MTFFLSQRIIYYSLHDKNLKNQISYWESIYFQSDKEEFNTGKKKKAIRTFWMEHLNSNASPEHYSRDAL